MNNLMAPKRSEWRGFGDSLAHNNSVTSGLLCESSDMLSLIGEDILAVHGLAAAAAPLSGSSRAADIIDMGWELLVIQCDTKSHTALGLLNAMAKQPLINRPAVILQISIEALDELFPVAELLEADILIGNDRAERIAALLGTRRRSSLAEQDEETTFMLRRLTEQMDVFARQLDRLSGAGGSADTGLIDYRGRPRGLASPEDNFRGRKDNTPWLINNGKAARRGAEDVRRIIAARRRRDEVFGNDLFADPAWDILLDLYASFLEERQVSVSSLCIAAAVPPTTALRWVKLMTKSGWLEREADPADRRRVYMRLSAKSLKIMQNYLDNIGLEDAALI